MHNRRHRLDRIAFSAFLLIAPVGISGLADQEQTQEPRQASTMLREAQPTASLPTQEAALQQMLVYHYCYSQQPKLIPCMLYGTEGI